MTAWRGTLTALSALAVCATLLLPAAVRADALTPQQPVRPVPMMTNLAPLADWGVQQPFIDRMKVARPWLGHLPGQWGGVDTDALTARGLLDAQGWPTRLPGDLAYIGTQVMVDVPETAQSLAGRYVLQFQGDGIVEVAGRATNKRYGANRVSFDYSPGPGGVEIRIQRTNPDDPVRAITVIREDRLTTYQAGATFNPDFLAVIDGFSGLRYMDWMDTNYIDSANWDTRARPDDYTYQRRGIPLELIARLANKSGSDPWITLPHLADDRYFRKAAALIRDSVDPDLKTYVEFSNEVWNWGFRQALWADEQAQARWGTQNQWLQFYGMRAAQMAQIWREVYGTSAADRLVTVLSTQTAWLGLEDQLLNAPLWQAEDPANPAPYTLFDAYAITGYVGGYLGADDGAAHVYDWLGDGGQATAFAKAGQDILDGRITGQTEGTVQDFLTRLLPYHLDIAQKHGLDLLMYEGGTHVAATGTLVDDTTLDQFFRAFNYSAEMGALYTHLMAGWAAQTDAPFTHYVDLFPPSKWGSWGALRHLGDDNPRWQAILRFRKDDGA